MTEILRNCAKTKLNKILQSTCDLYKLLGQVFRWVKSEKNPILKLTGALLINDLLLQDLLCLFILLNWPKSAQM